MSTESTTRLKLENPSVFDSLLHTSKNYGLTNGFTYPEYVSKHVNNSSLQKELLDYSTQLKSNTLEYKESLPGITTTEIYDTVMYMLKKYNYSIKL